jgi:hypothetical protein
MGTACLLVLFGLFHSTWVLWPVLGGGIDVWLGFSVRQATITIMCVCQYVRDCPHTPTKPGEFIINKWWCGGCLILVSVVKGCYVFLFISASRNTQNNAIVITGLQLRNILPVLVRLFQDLALPWNLAVHNIRQDCSHVFAIVCFVGVCVVVFWDRGDTGVSLDLLTFWRACVAGVLIYYCTLGTTQTFTLYTDLTKTGVIGLFSLTSAMFGVCMYWCFASSPGIAVARGVVVFVGWGVVSFLCEQTKLSLLHRGLSLHRISTLQATEVLMSPVVTFCLYQRTPDVASVVMYCLVACIIGTQVCGYSPETETGFSQRTRGFLGLEAEMVMRTSYGKLVDTATARKAHHLISHLSCSKGTYRKEVVWVQLEFASHPSSDVTQLLHTYHSTIATWQTVFQNLVPSGFLCNRACVMTKTKPSPLQAEEQVPVVRSKGPRPYTLGLLNGIHVHIGCSGPKDAMLLYRAFLPLVLKRMEQPSARLQLYMQHYKSRYGSELTVPDPLFYTGLPYRDKLYFRKSRWQLLVLTTHGTIEIRVFDGDEDVDKVVHQVHTIACKVLGITLGQRPKQSNSECKKAPITIHCSI